MLNLFSTVYVLKYEKRGHNEMIFHKSCKQTQLQFSTVLTYNKVKFPEILKVTNFLFNVSTFIINSLLREMEFYFDAVDIKPGGLKYKYGCWKFPSLIFIRDSFGCSIHFDKYLKDNIGVHAPRGQRLTIPYNININIML